MKGLSHLAAVTTMHTTTAQSTHVRSNNIAKSLTPFPAGM